MHDRAKDDWGNEHFDELNESVAERLQGLSGLRGKVSDDDADADGDEDLEVEEAIPGLARAGCLHGAWAVSQSANHVGVERGFGWRTHSRGGFKKRTEGARTACPRVDADFGRSTRGQAVRTPILNPP